jgi:VIT1/CCC1 family predicted Fe2+/Mn2+ transporter
MFKTNHPRKEETMLDPETRKRILSVQRNEITEHHIYRKLSLAVRDAGNQQVLDRISKEEFEHYHFWKKFTQTDVQPSRWQVWKYFFISRFLGITFGIKLMERGEKGAQLVYGEIARQIPDAREGILGLVKGEEDHEKQLVNLIDEERLRYVGSMVLGLNDALVELTGALAGLTLALRETRLIAMAGLITGIAASLSMAASQYLSTKTEGEGKDPIRATFYTSVSYVLTVFFLIFPFFQFRNSYVCLALTLCNAIAVIFIFTFYISVAKDIPFRKRFFEMSLASLGIAAISFGIGFLVKAFLHADAG